MKLLCDICGGQLQMTGSNDGATCVNCGMNYSIESLRNKLGGQKPAVSAPAVQIDPSEEDLPIAQVESAEEYIPVAQAEPVQEEDTRQRESVFYTEAPAATDPTMMRTLVLERKFDLQALRFGVSVLVDDEEVATLGSKGGCVSVPISQGSHEIRAVVWTGKNKVEAELEPFHIEVNEHDWYGLFYVRRTA